MRISAVVHGATLVSNAVIERHGAKTGMLVTTGFRDVLDMGLETRYDVFDLRLAVFLYKVHDVGLAEPFNRLTPKGKFV